MLYELEFLKENCLNSELKNKIKTVPDNGKLSQDFGHVTTVESNSCSIVHDKHLDHALKDMRQGQVREPNVLGRHSFTTHVEVGSSDGSQNH